MSEPDQPAPGPSEPGRPPGCLWLGIGAVVALFISVNGICGGAGDRSQGAMKFFVGLLMLALILGVLAVLAGLWRLITRR